VFAIKVAIEGVLDALAEEVESPAALGRNSDHIARRGAGALEG
jgi:hypothetical protein